MKDKTQEELMEEYRDAHSRNDVNVTLKKCPLCNDSKCEAYFVVVNNRTYVIVSQCRKIKIIENKKKSEDYWLVDIEKFNRPIKRPLEDFF